MKYWFDFLFTMTSKEFGVRYKRSYFGLIWIAINSLAQTVVIGLVFSFFVPVETDNYFLFLLAGLLPWNFFSQSLLKTTPAFYYERNLIKKAVFPKESIVLSILLSNLAHSLVTLGFLILYLFVFTLLSTLTQPAELIFFGLRLLLLIPTLFLLFIFSTGFSLISASLNVRFRDVNFFVQLMTQLWFYVTPVIYTLDIFPKQLQPYFYLNPMTFIVEMFRYSLLGSQITSAQLAPLSIGIIVITILLGIITFKKQAKFFDDWL